MPDERLRNAMSPSPTTVKAADDIVEAARLMASHDVGSLPVVDGENLLAIIRANRPDGGQGENCAQYLAKGRPVAVDGRLEWREWQDQSGNKR